MFNFVLEMNRKWANFEHYLQGVNLYESRSLFSNVKANLEFDYDMWASYFGRNGIILCILLHNRVLDHGNKSP